MAAARRSATVGLAALIALSNVYAESAKEKAEFKNLMDAMLKPQGSQTYADTSESEAKRRPRSSPPRTFYDGCVLQNMRGVTSDSAARSVREACESKQKQQVAATRAKFDQEYGGVGDESLVEAVEVETKGGSTRIALRNFDQRSKKIVSYVRLILGESSSSSGCKGSYEIFSFLTHIPPNTTTVVEIQAKKLPKVGEPCVEVVAVRVREPGWSDKFKAVTASRATPMPDDFLETYEPR